MPGVAPAGPVPSEPTAWEHYALWVRVRDAIRSLPDYFKTETKIEGILGTDIFTLNSVLGATIEEQVVASLNALRPVWDPLKEYQTYAFVRQPQTFPDVVLRKATNGQKVLMGIELKGWYLLAKEGEPNFRFSVTPAVCNPWDMLVVVPWVLSNVVAGSPKVHRPFIEGARYCAEQRNHYWQHTRANRTGKTGITLSTVTTPYPKKTELISDSPVSDKGGNYGRIARYGVMDSYVKELMHTSVRGIPAKEWLNFFKKFEKPGES